MCACYYVFVLAVAIQNLSHQDLSAAINHSFVHMQEHIKGERLIEVLLFEKLFLTISFITSWC